MYNVLYILDVLNIIIYTYYSYIIVCLQTPPVIKGRCFENAARRSFFSRDNMDKFIQFCRQLGVHQNLLFESDDLGMCLGLLH